MVKPSPKFKIIISDIREEEKKVLYLMEEKL